jgi:ABC-type multidrug transport system fused ATPase/permease subunit
MIQAFHRDFLALLLGHLLADFPFQTSWIVANKGKRWQATAAHTAIHFGVTLVVLWSLASTFSAMVIVVCAVIVAIHAVQDLGKERLMRWHAVQRFPATVFLLDQALHVFVLTIGALVLSKTGPGAAIRSLSVSPAGRDRILLVAVVYSGFVFGGGYLIRFLTRSLSNSAADSRAESTEEVRNAGLYIGWLERCLVLTAICTQSPAMVGLILAGKSIARLPELKEPRFAEYFLIGTFLSVGLAIVGGLILLYQFHGTVAFK